MSKIGIIGCGWLGKPLYNKLSQNYSVECFDRKSTDDNSNFWSSDTIIISINTKDNYIETLKKIKNLTSKNIILCSSISLYREFDNIVDESAIITKESIQKEAEEIFEDALILRLGGLMGYDRVAGRWKKVSKFQDGKVNYIHRDDVINIIELSIKTSLTKGVFNLVAPLHPLRSEVHYSNSKKFGFEMGSFSGNSNREILSNKIMNRLNYKFKYPNPLEFWD
ncbi:Protein yeeZ precursor [hydrothermal vent metagenome]|uniref:Protein yeeZ n=1 Tax=hydrothermal vent metagenome TaxID=652676 RepID=A0A1W1EIV3_9ZZZZ